RKFHWLDRSPFPRRGICFWATRIVSVFRSGASFAFQQLLLARDAPAPAAGRAIGAHHAMAWHDEREFVAAAGVTDGARGPGFADRAGDVGVAAGFARGDARQFLPYAPLEG